MYTRIDLKRTPSGWYVDMLTLNVLVPLYLDKD
jgi:hypothetical protein